MKKTNRARHTRRRELTQAMRHFVGDWKCGGKDGLSARGPESMGPACTERTMLLAQRLLQNVETRPPSQGPSPRKPL